MLDVRSNFFEHKLFITASGKFDLAEIKAAAINLLRNAQKLGDGFILITDIRNLSPASEEGRLEIQNILKELLGLGMAGEIRIVDKLNAVTTNQWQRTSRAIGYTAPEVNNLLEAEKLLDNMDQGE
jgi:hypothetical protein